MRGFDLKNLGGKLYFLKKKPVKPYKDIKPEAQTPKVVIQAKKIDNNGQSTNQAPVTFSVGMFSQLIKVVPKEELLQYGKQDLIAELEKLMDQSLLRARGIKNTKWCFGDRKVLAWSEIHSVGTEASPDVQLGREALRSLFKDLKKLKVKTLALELPHGFNKLFKEGHGVNENLFLQNMNKNKSIDKATKRFAKFLIKESGGLLDKNDVNNIMKKGDSHTEKIQGKNNSDENLKTKSLTSEWQEYFDLAKEFGINVVAVDCSDKLHFYNSLLTGTIVGLADLLQSTINEAYKLKKSGDEGAKLNEAKDKFLNLFSLQAKISKLHHKLISKRDKVIAKNIARLLGKKANGNILFTGGKMHISFAKKNSAMQLLLSKGVPVTTVECLFAQMNDTFKDMPVLGTAEGELPYDQKIRFVFEDDKERAKRFFAVNSDPGLQEIQREMLKVFDMNMLDKGFYNRVDGDSLESTTIFSTKNDQGEPNDIGNQRDTASTMYKSSFDAVVVAPPLVA